MRPTTGIFSGRLLVELRDGVPFIGDVCISAGWPSESRGSSRLKPEVQLKLRLFDHSRLHRCSVCRGYFIAHHAAMHCSPDCHLAAKRASNRKTNVRRMKLRALALQDAQANATCAHCARPIYQAKRQSKRYCRAACRQAAHRLRHASLGVANEAGRRPEHPQPKYPDMRS